jgi:tRNA pseudouridine38/39 synthase
VGCILQTAAAAAAARFDCRDREYKYFIVEDGGLDLAAMQAAAQHLVGEHDYRNFCKADVAQVG